ncbi:hypothetical protein NZD89_11535 [Alicyclobacillus fastidiosus]|uniref:Uncharacterized protein n=1 Tax=Alicyclobacillus fastidiosus TaxID=392011 RepID=A0ABY6ZP82_9BACL|nr:hypothetical protein [Alicyclobacillus fastidiosus]WAH43956.1 hypothetical protein NZD89_11535 [Alicyclobacillus fastidiosus]
MAIELGRRVRRANVLPERIRSAGEDSILTACDVLAVESVKR